jgi:hypothetical protein
METINKHGYVVGATYNAYGANFTIREIKGDLVYINILGSNRSSVLWSQPGWILFEKPMVENNVQLKHLLDEEW